MQAIFHYMLFNVNDNRSVRGLYKSIPTTHKFLRRPGRNAAPGLEFVQDLAATLVIYTCIILHHVVGTVAILAKHSPAIQVRMQRTAVAIAVIATRSTAFTE